MTLADQVAPGPGETRLHFLDEGIEITLGQLWNDAESFASWNTSHGCEPIGMVLSNSSACVTALLGAISSGAKVVSIPPPPRGADFKWYAEFVKTACIQSGAKVLAVDDEYLPLLPPLDSISYGSFRDLLSWKGRGHIDPENFSLVQFTSGSTAAPKGIVLGQEKIASNVSAILQWLQPRPGDGACSWLPLSHDMGLIGMFLSALAGAGPNWVNGGDIVILTPEGFLRRPFAWLEAMSQFGSTITSAPNFGFEMAMKRRGSNGLDLTGIRACITGAEPVRADTLGRFAHAFEADGFSSLAFCPAYGLAECTLAVAAIPPNEHWHALELDPDGIAEGEIRTASGDLKLVSSGRAVRGFEIQINSEAGIGEVLLKGDSVADNYADGTVVKHADGWFHTNDLGFVSDNELYIVGRLDDVFQVAGRKIYALDVEVHVGELSGIRPGRVVAFSNAHQLVVVAETEQQTCQEDESRRMIEMLRERIRRRVGVSPRAVALVGRGQLPMTSSGKTQRTAVRRALESGLLPTQPGSYGLRDLEE